MRTDYFAKVCPTYIENWDCRLYELSIPQADVPINTDEARILGSNIWEFNKWFDIKPMRPMDEIRERLENAFELFPKGAFVRLGSRSAKDSIYAQHFGLKANHVDDAMRMLTEASERVAFDLLLAIRNDYDPHIFVREWTEIPKWAEFRCFMKNRKLIGISQYDCKNLGRCPEIGENELRIRSAIEEFFGIFKEISHLDDVVFDVFWVLTDNKSMARLIELNPFHFKTDPCLFSWKDRDFDGSFRFL